MRLLSVLGFAATAAVAQLTPSSLEKHVDSATLGRSFNPVKAAYWTDYPHHRRTPFAVSPDGKSAWLAYLDASETGVHIQPIDPATFAAAGEPVTVPGGKEAGGLVAHDDGFALLTNELRSGGPVDTPVAVLYRFTAAGNETFKTWLGGPGVDAGGQAVASPDINGDLVFSDKAGYYAAYIVVSAYEGEAAGHFGDAVRYVDAAGALADLPGASSSWGCSHNTGIALEAADAPPFASLCAEDQGAIWLNTNTRGMTNDGVKVANEHAVNGASNEPMGGTSGSYSVLARFVGADSYIFTWVSRGATDLAANTWLGDGYTRAANRTSNRNVAVALFSDKQTLVGERATSEVGAADGDGQVDWVTSGANDCSNAHVAAFDGARALVTWEEIADPVCDHDAMGCRGAFAGTKFQMVGSDGAKLGDVLTSDDTFVAGDMVVMPDGRVCWPYVAMDWKLDGPVQAAPVSSMSFACMSPDAGTASPVASSAAPSPAPTDAGDGVASGAGAVDPFFAPGETPSPVYETISGTPYTPTGSVPALSSAAPTTESAAAPVEAPVASSSASVTAPVGAPAPIFETLSRDPAVSSAARFASVPAESSASAPAGAPSPIFETLSQGPVVSSAAPVEAPVASSSASMSAPAGAPSPIFETLSRDPVASSVAPSAGVPDASSEPSAPSNPAPVSAPPGAPSPIFVTLSGTPYTPTGVLPAVPSAASSTEPAAVPAETPAASGPASVSAPSGAPAPIFETLSRDPVASATRPASAPAGEPVASAPAEEPAASVPASVTAPAGAPSPIFETLSRDPVASSAARSVSFPVESLEPPAPPAPSSGASVSAPAGAPTPIFSTLPQGGEFGGAPSPTKCPFYSGQKCVIRTAVTTVTITV